MARAAISSSRVVAALGAERCSINFRPGQAAAAQRRMAAALSAGERFLAPWPRNLHDGNLFYLDPRSAAAAAEAALRASDDL